MIIKTFTAKTFDQACDLCRFLDVDYSDDLEVRFTNVDLQVTVKAPAPTMVGIEAKADRIINPVTPSDRTGLSGCGVHSFYVD